MSDPVHIPILTAEILDLLELRPGDTCIDATVNGGGHAAAFLERTAPDGRALGIDRDALALPRAHARHADAIASGRLMLRHGNFRELGEIAAAAGFADVRAILFDVGVSSYHFDRSGRGFRFAEDEPLDMRFDTEDDVSVTAAELVADASVEDLTRIIRELGEERFASRIARSIVRARERAPIESTEALVDAIRAALPANVRWRWARSAARVFQGLRIAVNDELTAVEEALPQAFELLAADGRLAVLSFHSLEDRLVKRAFVSLRQRGLARILTKKPLQAATEEIEANSRAASAKLRVCARVAGSTP